ncbi:MAG: YkgJ family cysteine cluster protein [Planctomycetaceae bacterium]|nr:YkgJ family cysteine cluster protein [Planctomycetaceae bacterium]
MRYECDQCGACCRQFLIECDDVDVLREQRLIEVDRHHAGKPVHEVVQGIRTEWKAVILPTPCPFLAENRCSIYPTRPNCCVGLDAGDEQCQSARAAEGLPPLLPVS